jgi:hypothetical protein
MAIDASIVYVSSANNNMIDCIFKIGYVSPVMKTRARKFAHDLRLKIAIIESRRTQRRMALETRIGETRLSEIVGHRMMPPTGDEKARIAKYLNRTIADLFDPEEADDAPPAPTANDAKSQA